MHPLHKIIYLHFYFFFKNINVSITSFINIYLKLQVVYYVTFFTTILVQYLELFFFLFKKNTARGEKRELPNLDASRNFSALRPSLSSFRHLKENKKDPHFKIFQFYSEKHPCQQVSLHSKEQTRTFGRSTARKPKMTSGFNVAEHY